MDEILSFIFRNQWLVLIIIGLVLVALAEVGFRAGLRLFVKKDEPRKGQIGAIQGAVLGMLALLLGFTFSMAVTRYETRRELVLREANAIGTTYLRASFLPETNAKAIEDLLRHYVDARLSFYTAGSDSAKITLAQSETARLQRELWSHTIDAAKEAWTLVLHTAPYYDETKVQYPGRNELRGKLRVKDRKFMKRLTSFSTATDSRFVD